MGYERGRATFCYEGLAQAASQPFGIAKSLASADLRDHSEINSQILRE